MKSIINYIVESQTNKKFTDVIIECDNNLLLLRRANYIKNFGGKWCLPGGHVDKNETSKTAILRELAEETAIQLDNVNFLTTFIYNTGESCDVYYEILTNKPTIHISIEHAQYKWVPLNEIHTYKNKFAGETYKLIEKYIERNK